MSLYSSRPNLKTPSIDCHGEDGGTYSSDLRSSVTFGRRKVIHCGGKMEWGDLACYSFIFHLKPTLNLIIPRVVNFKTFSYRPCYLCKVIRGTL